MFGVTVRSWKSLRTSYGPKRPSCKRSDRKESFLAFYRTRWLLMEMKHPYVEIEYCKQCRWLLRLLVPMRP